MLELPGKQKCCGCGACSAMCPAKAIAMRPDFEGFSYPRIDRKLCMDCGLCRRVCPVLAAKEPREPIAVYAVQAKDESLRASSSSGGVFSLLAREVLRDGGVAVGAAFDESDWHVKHIAVESENGLVRLRGSKYVQSDANGIYADIRRALLQNRKVLFSGTPCQAAAMRTCLAGVDDAKLLVVDVVCHAAPSPKAWRKYLAWRVKSAGALPGGVSFRRKTPGWKNSSLSISFADGAQYIASYLEDSFMLSFLRELCNRPSCHACDFKHLASDSDLTIADYWGVDGIFPDFDDNKGTSLVMVSTSRGAALFDAVRDKISLRTSNFKHACGCNPSILRPIVPHRNRTAFFRRLVWRKNYDKLVAKMLLPPLGARIRRFAGRILRKMGLIK